jgi:Ran-binding protein 3
LSPPAATTPASSFSSAAASTSAFGGLGAAKSNGFGGGGGFAGGSGAGSAFGGGSSGFGGLTGFGTLSKPGGLSTFAKPGAELKSGKPAKPFGAPESDNDDDDDDDDDDESGGDSGSDDESNDKTEKDRDDEKRKPRLQKVNVDDGETGEATILAVRAKLFYLNKDSGGWKERGAGMLKINVPGGSIEFDNEGATVPGSFDASVVEGDRRPRLILRQDQTHRVLLNTAIQPEAEFIEKTTLRATHVIFTALEGDDAKPVSITAKMSAASAKLFLAELDSVQQALREQ